MSKSVGVIIHFDEDQRNYLLSEERRDHRFSDALSVHDWEIKQVQVVLLSFSGRTIDFIALATKGSRVVTGKSRVEFSDLVDLGAIPLHEVEGLLSSNTKLHFMKSSTGRGGRLPEKTWLETIKALKEIRPDLVDEIERLISITAVSKYRLKGDSAEILLQEREALGAALDIFGGNNELRKGVLKSWAPKLDNVDNHDDDAMEADLNLPQDSLESFLSGIPERYIQEESAIQHDLFNWENERVALHNMGVSRFEQGSRVLEVVYANKNPLERTLGVDLIYYNKSFRSFVLVQYKLMKEKSGVEGFCYRPDEQLDKEVARINDFQEKVKIKSDISNHEEFRLNHDGFLYKLVPNKGLQAATGKLISGMYITHGYMKFLLGGHGPKGKRDGRLITFINSPRYLTNTEFSGMVNRGWIGTSSDQSNSLAQIISDFLETGRAVMVAVEEDFANKQRKTDA
ncbi:hypothetical protein EVC62_06710 [Salinicola endophyticus]|uniref:DUF4263 domain-containing protein n=1 Tax=Salinicola endophyticus TaxID=1949083 RepID=A0ABY8FF82_9GAMM|nr:hypothetical protein [Salinicola endophyticus]WFF41217.1 hypothetical protein EVC62_06710 [Salinicola endophyticus]